MFEYGPCVCKRGGLIYAYDRLQPQAMTAILMTMMNKKTRTWCSKLGTRLRWHWIKMYKHNPWVDAERRTILWATNNDGREIADEVHTDPFCNWVFIYQIKLLYPYLSALLLLLMPPSAHPNSPPTITTFV